MYLTYKYRLYPNKEQIEKIEFNIKNSNKVRNICIANNEKELAKRNAKKLLDKYLSEYIDLKRSDYSALINSLFKLSDEKDSNVKTSRNSYTTSYSEYLAKNYPIKPNKIFISKVGYVRYKNSRTLPDDVKPIKLTIKREDDKYYVLITVSQKEKTECKLNIDKSVGFDYSSRHFAVDNNGNKYDLPLEIKMLEKKIKKKYRVLKRKEIKSNRYKEIQDDINKIYAKISRIRMNYLHELSSKFANEFDYIMVETLDLEDLSRKKNMGKATKNNAYASFVKLLEYKMEMRGKKLIKIDRWFPSSKMCNKCQSINHDLELNDRTWRCSKCGEILDRDINAAINLRNEGIKIIKTVG
ncbi:MAG: transposase [Erysipelotrichaceae bacterium]|nr:transposase [Erysipelotrichaceae bacterium]